MLRPTPTRRNRAALREGVVRRDRDMSRHDDISGGGGGMVSRHVHGAGDRKGLGVDRRG